jgi:DNA-directed RNA polymerase specialized sigma24 family protein
MSANEPGEVTFLPSEFASLNQLQGLSGENRRSIADQAKAATVSSVDALFSVPGVSDLEENLGELSGLNGHVRSLFAEVVARKIRGGDETGIQDLYEILAEGACARVLRRVAPESREDRRHDIVVIVVEAVRSGELRDPHRLMGFIWTVTRRSVAAYIRDAIFRRRRFVASEAIELPIPIRKSPEILVVERERAERARLTIRCLRPRDREILERFYFHEQGAQQICSEMRLTATQFRLYKSRAIARCGDRLRGVSAMSPVHPVNSRVRLAARIA